MHMHSCILLGARSHRNLLDAALGAAQADEVQPLCAAACALGVYGGQAAARGDLERTGMPVELPGTAAEEDRVEGLLGGAVLRLDGGYGHVLGAGCAVLGHMHKGVPVPGAQAGLTARAQGLVELGEGAAAHVEEAAVPHALAHQARCGGLVAEQQGRSISDCCRAGDEGYEAEPAGPRRSCCNCQLAGRLAAAGRSARCMSSCTRQHLLLVGGSRSCQDLLLRCRHA